MLALYYYLWSLFMRGMWTETRDKNWRWRARWTLGFWMDSVLLPFCTNLVWIYSSNYRKGWEVLLFLGRDWKITRLKMKGDFGNHERSCYHTMVSCFLWLSATISSHWYHMIKQSKGSRKSTKCVPFALSEHPKQQHILCEEALAK